MTTMPEFLNVTDAAAAQCVFGQLNNLDDEVTFTVTGNASAFPDGNYLVSVWDKSQTPNATFAGDREVIWVRVRTGNQMTGSRAQQGTATRAHPGTPAVELHIMAAHINALTSRVATLETGTAQTAIAGGTLSGQMLVASAGDGFCHYADSATTIPGTVLGFTATTAAPSTAVVILDNGELVTSGLTPGAVYYVGSAGAIRDTPPASGLIQSVGTAKDATHLAISLGTPFVKV